MFVDVTGTRRRRMKRAAVAFALAALTYLPMAGSALLPGPPAPRQPAPPAQPESGELAQPNHPFDTAPRPSVDPPESTAATPTTKANG
ncbi:hypothetical protein AB0H57_18145 [Micromonospora sp. NPDC050686]|uniref:hypothetical protein n=1 Tax=Micromonospora sp. NPDC050686 TaxID=3154631 RepID=UPI0033FD7D2B